MAAINEVADQLSQEQPRSLAGKTLLPHQTRTLAAFRDLRAREPGLPSLIVAPPGAGKSLAMIQLAVDEVAAGGSVVLKVHRKMLLEQMAKVFSECGIEYGIVAAGYTPDASKPIQLVSTQTLYSRSVKTSRLALPDCSLLIDDEAHQQGGDMQRALVYGSYSGGHVQHGYASRGAYVVGFTATPLMDKPIYQRIIEMSRYSELRRLGMHQLVKVYSPDEIDTKGLKANEAGEFSEKALEKRVEVIFGSAFDEWKHLNPDGRPAILYAPSVPSARWFAHEFMKRGVPVAHLDGELALIPEGGRLVSYPTDRDSREEVLRLSRTGEVKLLTNRFILREAIDMPWLYHAIFATVMGSLTTYLQSVGRLQRFWAEYETKILQCHGGSFWRHGSPNMDRQWRLGASVQDYAKQRIEQLMKGAQEEGIRCPKCGMWRYRGGVCLNESCRHVHTGSVRAVRSVSGRLKQMHGKVYVAEQKKDASQKLWTATLFQCAKQNLPVSSAVAMFVAAAQRRGISGSLQALWNKPPPKDSVQYQKSVRVVYPWTHKPSRSSASPQPLLDQASQPGEQPRSQQP